MEAGQEQDGGAGTVLSAISEMDGVDPAAGLALIGIFGLCNPTSFDPVSYSFLPSCSSTDWHFLLNFQNWTLLFSTK